MIAMFYNLFCIVMLVHHILHEVKECIDIHISTLLVPIKHIEVVKHPSVTFCNHFNDIFQIAKIQLFFKMAKTFCKYTKEEDFTVFFFFGARNRNALIVLY